jgi:hypothetical protein
MCQTKAVEKIKTQILCSVFFVWKTCYLRDNLKRYGSPRQATDDSIIMHMCYVCWITKATNTPWEYVICIVLQWHHWLHKCTVMLHYAHVACLVCTAIFDILALCNCCKEDLCHCGNIVVRWNVLYTLAEVFCAFSSIVRQMPGYNSQRRGMAHTY